MRYILPFFALTATPTFAAGETFVSLRNTDFVVLLAFLLFIAILVYMKVPSKVAEMLDARAKGIRADLDEARALREEAQSLLASYERKQKEVQSQADRIVASAREDAEAHAEKAREDLQRSVERRVQAAREQIAQAEDDAKRRVRNRAVEVAVAAARDVLRTQMDGARQDRLLDSSIATVREKMH